jgi:hypothetical protein
MLPVQTPRRLTPDDRRGALAPLVFITLKPQRCAAATWPCSFAVTQNHSCLRSCGAQPSRATMRGGRLALPFRLRQNGLLVPLTVKYICGQQAASAVSQRSVAHVSDSMSRNGAKQRLA